LSQRIQKAASNAVEQVIGRASVEARVEAEREVLSERESVIEVDLRVVSTAEKAAIGNGSVSRDAIAELKF